MKRATIVIIFGISGPVFAQMSIAPAPLPDVSVATTLRMAEAASPDLKAAIERERAAEQSVRLSQSFYYPTVNAEAIDSFGFPGSSRDLGVSGLMGSPYRSGPAAGISADLDLYNPVRGYAVQRAKKELEAVKAATQIVRYQVDQRALQIFMDASRFRGKGEVFNGISTEVGHVEKEVDRFVKTGQRSIVERLLVQDQTADAQMTAATFLSRYQVALQRLAVVTGSTGTTLSCAVPQMIPEAGLGLLRTNEQSPLLVQALAQASAAHAAVNVYSAQFAPRVMATASVGDMDRARLVDKKEYSGGFGLQVPLFDGYRIHSAVHQAQAFASARDNDQLAVRMDIDQINAQYDETIESSHVQLDYLQKELDVAARAFKLAKDRYISFQGTLVDVREALRNLARVQEEMVDIKADLLLALGSKMLLDGGMVVSK